jgi:hypothetical protein
VKILEGIAAGEHAERSLILDLTLVSGDLDRAEAPALGIGGQDIPAQRVSSNATLIRSAGCLRLHRQAPRHPA